jgi:hypothetical protein
LSRTDLTLNTVNPDAHRSFDECINIALALYNGNGFANPFWGGLTGPSAHCAPVYPAVTAVIFSAFGPDDAGARARDMLNTAGFALLYALLLLFSASLGMTTAPGLVAGFAAELFPLYGHYEMSQGRDEWPAALLGDGFARNIRIAVIRWRFAELTVRRVIPFWIGERPERGLVVMVPMHPAILLPVGFASVALWRRLRRADGKLVAQVLV